MDMGHRPGWSRGWLKTPSFSLGVPDLLLDAVHAYCRFLPSCVVRWGWCGTHDTSNDLQVQRFSKPSD